MTPAGMPRWRPERAARAADAVGIDPLGRPAPVRSALLGVLEVEPREEVLESCLELRLAVVLGQLRTEPGQGREGLHADLLVPVGQVGTTFVERFLGGGELRPTHRGLEQEVAE